MAFRGASADAVATLTDDLSARVSGGADAARVGEDLFSVAAVLRSEPGLRRVATDASVAAEAKSGLVRELLADQVSETALALVASAVERRWTVARDLADALEHLGVVAVVASAGEADRLADELFAVEQLVKHNPELRDALSDPSRSAADKRGLVRGLLEGRTLPATTTLVEQALAGSHRTVGVALQAYQQVAAQVHGQGVATVRVARPLADADRQRLTDALARQHGREVHLNVVVDPAVIGGIRVEIGDDVIDGTVLSRLDEAKRKLAG
jgi:F-type H+-transporting ATPase subunit delta